MSVTMRCLPTSRTLLLPFRCRARRRRLRSSVRSRSPLHWRSCQSYPDLTRTSLRSFLRAPLGDRCLRRLTSALGCLRNGRRRRTNSNSKSVRAHRRERRVPKQCPSSHIERERRVLSHRSQRKDRVEDRPVSAPAAVSAAAALLLQKLDELLLLQAYALGRG